MRRTHQLDANRFAACAITVAAASALAPAMVIPLSAHITPVVVVHKQADVIRQTLPGAVAFSVTTVKLGKPELQQIVERAHYTPNVEQVKFYSGKDASGAKVGTVVFPQVDTPHGPIEVGVTIGPAGAATRVLVTRATAETKPWVVDVERSGVLDLLTGTKPGDGPKHISEGRLNGMAGYMADAIATATFRGLAMYAVLAP